MIRSGLKHRRRGLTLLEVMIAMVILAAVMLSVGRNILFLSKQSVDTQDRAFAAQKAIQMMEELRGLISNTNSASIGVLDDYDDGALTNPVLTTRKEVTDPADVLSGNGARKYVRRVSVIQMPNEPLARRVYVRVFSAKTMKPLAETVSILRTISNQFASSQVFDVYVIAVENVPGWWVSLSKIKPMFDNIVQDLQTRNPGLEWRTHWITRMSYGRDPYYTPFVNDATKTEDQSPPSVYFYPGSMNKSGADFQYYVPGFFQGRVKIDGTVTNAAAYSMADQYNNCVRYPEEVSLYNSQVSAATSAGDPAPEMSLRMLLEKMNSSPDDLRNAIIVNLHGELLPAPPLRNYSDAAKWPTTWPNVRVVTHPEQLEYPSGNQVKLRVYSYVMNPDAWAHTSVLSTMTVLLPSVQLSAFQLSIRKVVGNATVAYAWQNAVLGTDYTVTSPAIGQTLITLYNSPLRCPLNGATGGLPSSDRLYGLEYIPCAVGAQNSFPEGNKDLGWNNTTRAKNTARWVISFSTGVIPDGQLTVETRIGNDETTGTSLNQLTNISRTYTWVGTGAPATEKYQYLGDPRYLPYCDVKWNDGYNWYFTSVPSGRYEGFTKTTAGWAGNLNFDVPRLFKLYREGIVTSGALYNSITGWSNYYIGLGGEMGYDDANGFPTGLRIRNTPWVPTQNLEQGVNEIIPGYDQSNTRLISNAANSWFGRWWIGELYPDGEEAAWQANGNLPVGAGNYYRANYTTYGSTFSFNPYKRTSEQGAPSFFNGGNGTAKWFSHAGTSDVSNLTATGLVLSSDFNYPMASPFDTPRPFRLDDNTVARRPPEWNDTTYSNIRTSLSTSETYYDPTTNASTYDTSALVRARIGAGSSYGNFVINGLAASDDVGSSQIGKISALALLRGFMQLGATGTSDRIPQVPLVSISSPTTSDTFVNPSTVTVSWSSPWTRWDGQPYTASFSSTYNEGAPLTYNVKYSNDNGKHWYFIQDGALAEAGVKDAGHSITAPYVWNVSSLPEGSYIIRVEGYRNARTLHYTYHQRQIYVFR